MCRPHKYDSQYCVSLRWHKRGNKYKENFMGPKTEPGGTPQTRMAKSDKIPSITTLCVRPEKYDFISCKALPLNDSDKPL